MKPILEHTCSMSYFCTNPSPTSTRTPRATAPTERPENVPDDAILYSLFANDHGVPYRTFGDQIDDRKTPAITTIDPRRGNKKRWLTPEHQRAAIEYWTRNGNEWNWCERPSCPCHDY